MADLRSGQEISQRPNILRRAAWSCRARPAAGNRVISLGSTVSGAWASDRAISGAVPEVRAAASG
jgi:hypothetical protein